MSVFVNKDLVRPETIINAHRIVGRNEELDRIIELLLPAVNGNHQDNILAFGPSGTGKSLILNAVAKAIATHCEEQGIAFGVVGINCQRINSEDKAVYTMLEALADTADTNIGIQQHGTATSAKYDRLYKLVNQHYEAILFIIDEIDYLTGYRSGDEPDYSRLLYQLSRATAEGEITGRSAVTAITNDTQLMQTLDGRAASSFHPASVVFPDYDADQLHAILECRQDAFRDGALTDDVIPLAAAIAAKNEGDARTAVDLLRKAGELADHRTSEVVTERHVRVAQETLHIDQAQKTITGLSTQKAYTLYAFASVAVHAPQSLESVPGPVAYDIYSFITTRLQANTKSNDSFRRYATELSSYNLLSKRNTSRGRSRGVHTAYTFVLDPTEVTKLVGDDHRLPDLDHTVLQEVVHTRLTAFRRA